jgi:hypothetical protein
VPDFYVNAATGSDANPGTASRPFRTVTRATHAAADADDGATGTIFVANGSYGGGEEFPILVPPRFALEGESREGCEIRFRGFSVVGGIVNGVAVHGGHSVRHLAIVADPPPSLPLTCSQSVGLEVLIEEEECIVEDVAVRTASGAPPESGFGFGIWMNNVRGSATALRLSANSLALWEFDGTIRACDFREGGPLQVFEGGVVTITDCEFTDSALGVSGAATTVVQSNRFVGTEPNTRCGIVATGGAPTVRANHVRGVQVAMWCDSGSHAVIENNFFSGWSMVVRVDRGASPTLRSNTIELNDPTHGPNGKVLWVQAGGSPRFDGNFFLLRTEGIARLPILVSGSADFGGGALGSRGRNHFGHLRGAIRFDYPGPMFARDNFWRDAPPFFWTEPDLYSAYGWYQLGESTTVSVDGALLDPDRDS